MPLSTRLVAILEFARLDPSGRELPADAFVFGDEVGRRVTTFKKAWQVTLLKASGHEPEWRSGGSPMRAVDSSPHSICTSTISGTKPDRGGSKAGCPGIT